MITYKSPAGPPRRPAFHLPAMRIRWPSRVPPLILTSSGWTRSTLPSPWHTGHVEIFFPVPWQRGHCTLNFMRPPVCSIVPLPLHCGHLPGASIYPCPRQLLHASRRVMFSCITPPRIAVQNGTLTSYSRSFPGSGPSSACALLPPPLNIDPKMSRNPPPPLPLPDGGFFP